MENKVGVLTPNLLKELHLTASTREEMETAVSPMAFRFSAPLFL